MATLTGTNGDDVLIGTPQNDIIKGLDGNYILVGGGGNNCLIDRNGNDALYGNFRDPIIAPTITNDPINLTIDASVISPTIINVTNSVPFTFGSNTLKAGNGSDTLYGNISDLNIAVIGGDVNLDVITDAQSVSVTETASSNIHFGNNSLCAGNGGDTLFGNLHVFLYSVSSGFLTANVSANNDSISLQENSFGNISFGKNTLTSGNGADMLYGNMHDFQLAITGGGDDVAINTAMNDVVAITNHTSNLIDFSSNKILSGDGNDTLFGNLNSMNLAITGGSANTDTSATAISNHININETTANLVNFDGNLLQGGNGNDALFGNQSDLIYSVSGQNLTATLSGDGNHLSINDEVKANLCFGSNALYGGNGNDTLFGNLNDMLYSVAGGKYYN